MSCCSRHQTYFFFLIAFMVVVRVYRPDELGRTHPKQVQVEKKSEWELYLPSGQRTDDWCPTTGDGKTYVQSLYSLAASELPATCNEIQRVGADGDGGKFICTDDFRPSDCVVYSLGSRLDFQFEIEFLKRFSCKVRTFDCTVGTPLPSQIPSGVSFYPWCIGDEDKTKVISSDLGHQGELGQYYTLTTIREILGDSKIDLLKMDIERHEFAVVGMLKADFAPRQIAFETHLHNAYGMWGRPVTETEWSNLWEKLRGLGYGVFSYEPNAKCHCCCEFSVRQIE